MDIIAKSKADFGQTAFEYQLYHLLAVCHWVSYSASLSLHVLICVMGLPTLPVEGCYEVSVS